MLYPSFLFSEALSSILRGVKFLLKVFVPILRMPLKRSQIDFKRISKNQLTSHRMCNNNRIIELTERLTY